MKSLALAAIAALIVVPGSTAARQTNPTIEVVAPTLAAWSARVGHELDRSIQRTYMPEGVMALRFKCSDSGRPQAIEVTMGSGSAEFDATGKQIIAGLKSLHALPNGIGHDQIFEATIQVAGSQAEYSHQLARLQRHQMLARAAGQSNVLAIAAVSVPRG